MEGWILYKHSMKELRPDAYEINHFIKTAKTLGINIRVLKPEEIDLLVTREDRKSILVNGGTTTLPDFLLPRMGSGTTYFALSVIRHLERLGIKTFNSSHSIDIVKDKLYTQQILAESDLPVPKTMLAKFPINSELVEKHIGFPVVVKTISGSQGKGVHLSSTKHDFEDLMHFIETTDSKANIIVQEYIKTSHGKDLRVFIIGGKVVACMERRTSDNSFKANFSRGANVIKYKVSSKIEWLATETARILNLDIAGIDLLFDGDNFRICEANSSPGFKGIEKCHNIDIPKEIYKFIKLRLGVFED